jgi:hypothetical protein
VLAKENINLKGYQKMKTISKIIFLAFFMAVFTSLVNGQSQPYPTSTLNGTDTIKNVQTKTYTQTILGNWHWSVQVAIKHVSGSGDSTYCYLTESDDGVHYQPVVGSVAPLFKTDSNYVWSGGTGNLPLVWSSKYLGVKFVHLHTATIIPTVTLQKKICIDR